MMDTTVTRRNLLVGAVAAAATGAFAASALADESGSNLPGMTSVSPDSTEGDAVGVMNITLDELNQMRRDLIDSRTEYTCADGTVIPEVYVKLRACVEGYGLGVGSNDNDSSFDFFMRYWTPEEAQAYIEMPLGIAFTAADFAQQSGRDEDECETLCSDLSYRGLLMRWTRAGVHYYHHIAYAHGLWEYGLLAQEALDENDADFKALDTVAEWAELHETEDLANAHERADLHSTVFADDAALFTSETPFYYPVPVSRDVVADEEGVLPLDDWEKIIERNEVIGVSTCQCRLRRVLQGDLAGEDTGEHPMETCMSFGEEAQYYIENGIARQIDKQEAHDILQRSADLGLVIQSAYSKATEIICSCHGDCCDILSTYVALGAEGCAAINSMPQVSHYNLVVDTDLCVKCGACAARCPLYAITMTDDGPQVDAKCVRCGQCATVCPVEARKLVAKENNPELPDDMLADYNLKAAYRFTHGLAH
jgi:ferredoxin